MYLFNVHEAFPKKVEDFLSEFSRDVKLAPKSMYLHCTELTAVTSRPELLGRILQGAIEGYDKEGGKIFAPPCLQPNLEFRITGSEIWGDQLVLLFEKTKAHVAYHHEVLTHSRPYVITRVPMIRHTDSFREVACHPGYKNALNPSTFREEEYLAYSEKLIILEEDTNEGTAHISADIDPATKKRIPVKTPSDFGLDNYTGIPFIGRKRNIHSCLGRITEKTPDLKTLVQEAKELIGYTFPVTELGIAYEENKKWIRITQQSL